MSEHYNTSRGWPQTRAEVEASSDGVLTDFMGMCDVEPADYDDCLACYAFFIVQEREDRKRASQVRKLEEQKTAVFKWVDNMFENENTNDITDWRTVAKVIIRLYDGWELIDDNHGTWRWYSETKPGFDQDELPTEAEMDVLNAALKMR